MKRYQFLLFDADGTLLDFDRCEEKALRDTLLFYGISTAVRPLHAIIRSTPPCGSGLTVGRLIGHIRCAAGLSSCASS